MHTSSAKASTALRTTLALTCVAALAACARARRDDESKSENSSHGTSGVGAAPDAFPGPQPNPFYAGSGAKTGAAGRGASSGSAGATTECRGPGLYNYGKGSPRLPCCAGYQEFYLETPGYDDMMHKACAPAPGGGTYACLEGVCGDGRCEDAESAACGCITDCPGAAWEGTDTDVPPSRENGFTEPPASCSKPDVLARLQTSPDSIDCGNLSYKASDMEESAAISCVRDALEASKPFQVFWETLGTDSVNPSGLVGRIDNNQLQVFYLAVYDVNAFGLALDGATAIWQRCRLKIDPACTTDPDTCLLITRLDRTRCDCLPQGKRPGAADGDKVELRCKSH
jgi:hypothetical protein